MKTRAGLLIRHHGVSFQPLRVPFLRRATETIAFNYAVLGESQGSLRPDWIQPFYYDNIK